jgi:hypothetical protein
VVSGLQIFGSHGGDREKHYLLEYDTIQSSRNLPITGGT